MTEEDEEDFEKNNKCRFREKEADSDKVREYCHLPGKYRGPARKKCKTHVAQKQKKFNPFASHVFSIYHCHLFFKKLIVKKNDKVQLDIIPKTSGEYIPVTYGCIKFRDSYRLLSSSSDSLVITHVNTEQTAHKNLKKEIVGDDSTLNIVYEIATLISTGRIFK